MKLTYNGLLNKAHWQERGYQLPLYDIPCVRAATLTAPRWLHLGAGNIFRAFLAHLQQQLLDRRDAETGIIVAEGYDEEIIEKTYRPHDNLSIYVRLKGDRSLDKIVLASVIESLTMRDDLDRLRDIAANPGLQMVSLTITEKGYAIKDQNGHYHPAVAHDLANGTARPQSYIGNLVTLLYTRWQQGGAPLALVSMDNMSRNGETLRATVLEFAHGWQETGHVPPDFVAWLASGQVSYPWTMIDKITPRPDSGIAQLLATDGLENIAPVETAKHSYTAPYVNAEELEYLVIEDDFPNGRPPLEKAGVLFTDRDTVNKVETMKVTTCLNPIHTALAIYGCLLGYTAIHAEMQDADLVRLARAVGYREGLPVVVDPGILNPQQFIDEVVNIRLPNPYIPDTPQRIATDTSQKLAIRFGHTIKAHGANAAHLTAIPLVLAGWCRYLLGVDDNGKPFTCSPDPRLAEAQATLKGVRVGSNNLGNVRALLENADIFGVNLYDAGLGAKVEDYLRDMLAGNGAVRATLQKHLPA
ncbi:mannitol dehydrogenase family protein [uncultured Cardiobacterium sp.]|uniref:mannitol dehydrogenase family protein n=1 Tax=uncultured Cardiobacterium sp. TaxID=417619 RepID=UPI00261DF4BF|nr:mannitol dehydrogenase family protein [uncultured Cardiobacterium sp.]